MRRSTIGHSKTGTDDVFGRDSRRLKKVVTNSGDYDKTEVYLYGGHTIIETRDGSGNVVQQFIHGMQYIDELVMMRVKDKGDLYVHQDANWNVIGLTDLGGHVVERNVYTPYGQLTAHKDTSFGDWDGDGDVDATDKGTPGTTCTGTVTGACRILDLDFDGDYDATDATAFDNLEQGLARHPGRAATGVDQPFAHQGLLFDAEIGSYQNRAREYAPAKRRFAQRDPWALLGGFDLEKHYEDGMNPYAYVRNAPQHSQDPYGLCVDPSEPIGCACFEGGVTTSCSVTGITQAPTFLFGCAIYTDGDITDTATSECATDSSRTFPGCNCVICREVNGCVTFPWVFVRNMFGCTITVNVTMTTCTRAGYGYCAV